MTTKMLGVVILLVYARSLCAQLQLATPSDVPTVDPQCHAHQNAHTCTHVFNAMCQCQFQFIHQQLHTHTCTHISSFQCVIAERKNFKEIVQHGFHCGLGFPSRERDSLSDSVQSNRSFYFNGTALNQRNEIQYERGKNIGQTQSRVGM